MGNRADLAARDAASEEIDLHDRDADVELSPLGYDQARAVGRWLDESAPEPWRPTLVVTSPYRRAYETARAATAQTGLPLHVDERLRERDLGAFDGLTLRGIRARHPQEAARRDKLGKFYYQPPGGESWADVALRVRSFLADLGHGFEGERIWLFTHQAVIMAFRYVLEDIDEQRLLAIDRETQIPNASLTRYAQDGLGFALETFADNRAVGSHSVVTEEESA
jgi:broad specificity phosphatase PhoE